MKLTAQHISSALNLFHKMKFPIIFIVILVIYCDAKKWLCPVNMDNAKNFRQFHCQEDSNLNRRICYSTDSFIEMILMNNSEVSELKMSQCDSIYVLRCLENYKKLNLLDISYSGYKNLDSFDLNHTHLVILNASNNELNEIPKRFFKNIPEITELDFSHNNLSNIASHCFDGANKLTKIHLANNSIANIEFNDFSQIFEYLDLRNNMLHIFNNQMFDNNRTNLKELHLEGNQMYWLPKMPKTISIYVSWKEYSALSLVHFDDEYHIILNDQIEGILTTQNGYSELHCTQRSFEKLTTFAIKPNQIKNVHDLLQCLEPSLVTLNLGGNFIGEVNSTTFSRFINLRELSLTNTHLKNFDFIILKRQINLTILDISRNNLENVKNVQMLRYFKHLKHFSIAKTQLKTATEIIHSLNSNIKSLDVSDNFVGEVDSNMFGKLSDLGSLILRNTSLKIIDVNPFDQNFGINSLDISYNDLSHLNFSTMARTLGNLQHFHAAGCQINNAIDIFKPFWSRLLTIDLSNNFVGEVTRNTFINTKFFEINLDNTNLSHFEITEHLARTTSLVISHNQLKVINFKIVLKRLKKIYVEDNNLVELVNFNRAQLPKLNTLAIANNNFWCEYLKKLMEQIKLDWPDLQLIDDPLDQKNHEDCHSKIDKQSDSNEMAETIEMVKSDIPFANGSIETMIIGFKSLVIPSVAIITIAGACFACHRCLSRETSINTYDEVPVTHNVEQIEMSTIQSEEDVEHIYAEIGPTTNPNDYAYDHLRFGLDPKPISNYHRYHNLTLLNRETLDITS